MTSNQHSSLAALRRFTGSGALEKLEELAKEVGTDSNEASTEDATLFLGKDEFVEPIEEKVRHAFILSRLSA